MSSPATAKHRHAHAVDPAPAQPRIDLVQAVLRPAAVVLLIGTVFVGVYLAAFHAPRPHGLRVGTTQTGTDRSALRAELDHTLPGGFTLVSYPDAAGARQAVEDRSVYGAYLADGTLVYAGANGASVTTTLTQAFGPVAAAEHQRLTLEDVVPTNPGDTRGLSVFYAAFGLVLAGYLFGMTTYQMAPRLEYRWRMLSLAVFGCAGGLVITGLAGALGFHAVPGPFPQTALVVALMGAAVGATTMVLLRVFGAAGVSLASILMLILGNATSGGIMPPAYLPGWLRPLSEVLPVGVGVRAIQGLSYFHDDGFVRALIVLPLWLLGAVAVLFVKDVAATTTSRRPRNVRNREQGPVEAERALAGDRR